jgi:hypothetical protein
MMRAKLHFLQVRYGQFEKSICKTPLIRAPDIRPISTRMPLSDHTRHIPDTRPLILSLLSDTVTNLQGILMRKRQFTYLPTRPLPTLPIPLPPPTHLLSTPLLIPRPTLLPLCPPLILHPTHPTLQPTLHPTHQPILLLLLLMLISTAPQQPTHPPPPLHHLEYLTPPPSTPFPLPPLLLPLKSTNFLPVHALHPLPLSLPLPLSPHLFITPLASPTQPQNMQIIDCEHYSPHFSLLGRKCVYFYLLLF